MMKLFKTGDVCIGRGFDTPMGMPFNGIECTIVSYVTPTIVGYNQPWYEVSWANGESVLVWVAQDKLKLKRPPETLSSWELITDICKSHKTLEPA